VLPSPEEHNSYPQTLLDFISSKISIALNVQTQVTLTVLRAIEENSRGSGRPIEILEFLIAAGYTFTVCWDSFSYSRYAAT